MAAVMRSAHPSVWMAEIFLCNQRDVCRYFHRRLRQSRQDAADLTQEVGLRFMSLDQKVWPDNPRAYLFGIARHVLAEYLESRTRRFTLDEVLRLEPLSTLGGSAVFRDPAESVADQQLGDYLLRKLPRRQRAVLLAQAANGYSYQEVAAQLGITVFAVEKDLSLAKTHLRALCR